MELLTASGAGSATPNPGTTSGQSVLSSDFEVFLKMLTAQAEYQDPLEPMDSSEYAAQLAQFSMVEQQVTTNDLIEQMLSALGVNDMAGAANWIGMDVLVEGPVHFDGGSITVASKPHAAADEVTLVVSNTQGREVQRLPISTTADALVWDGRKADGSVFDRGGYSFRIESASNGTLLQSSPAPAYSRVSEARMDNGAMTLILAGGQMVETVNVKGVRDPVQDPRSPT